MITNEMKQKAWNYGSASKAQYNALTDEQKKAMWEYGRDNKLYDVAKVSDLQKSEINKYLGESKQDSPSKLPDLSFNADRTSQKQGIKLPDKFDYTPQPKKNILQQGFDKVKELNKTVGDTLHAADAAALKTASLGLSEKAIDKFAPKVSENIKKVQSEHPIATKTGEMAGYAVPFGGIEAGLAKAGGKALAKVGSNLGKRAILGSISGAIVGGAESAVRGDNVKDITKNTAIGAGLGLGGELLGAGIKNTPKLLKSLKPTTKQTTTLSGLPKAQSNIVSSAKKEPLSFKEALNKVYAKVVDSNNPGKKVSDEFYTKATNSKSVSGIIDHNLTEAMVDMKGNKIGRSLKDVAEQIPKGKEEDFWTYMSQRHNIDRAREEKQFIPKKDSQGNLVLDKNGHQVYDEEIIKKATPVQANYTPDMSREAVKQYEVANPEYKQIGDNITKWIDDFMRTWGVDAGTVDKDVYKSLRDTYKSYFPTQRDFSTLEKSIPNGISQKFVDARTPIKKVTGSERDIINPLENIMNLVNRTVRTAKYNDVGKSLLDSVRKDPAKLKALAEEITVKDGMFSNLDNVVTVLENGKPTYLQINDQQLLNMLNGLPKNIANIKVLSTITNAFKSLITQKNPLFAIKNIFRDLPTSYAYGSEGNPLKFTRDLLKAGKDVLTSNENFQRYKGIGGGGGNFFNSGKVAKSAEQLTGRENILKKAALSPIRAIEKFNNLTETAPRLAEFNRVLNKTGDVEKALYAANDVSVNFSRGGHVIKTLDRNGVPYLNVGVQGLDKFFRGFKNPRAAVATIIKSGVAISTPEVALYLINKDNPAYKELDNRTKDTYYLIPKSDGTFFKIPKSRELGVLFGSLLSRIGRKINGEKTSKAFDGFLGTVGTNFSPSNPVENNILAPMIYNLPVNKDFAGRTIVPRNMTDDNRSPYLQYDEKTTEISKKIAEYAKKVNIDISPKQLDYLIKSYTGVIGQFGIPATTKNGDPLKTLTSQFVSDPIYSNQTLTDFYNNFDTLKRKASDKNILDKIPTNGKGNITTREEAIRNKFNKASLEISDLNKRIRKLTDEEEIRKLRLKILDIARRNNSMLK